MISGALYAEEWYEFDESSCIASDYIGTLSKNSATEQGVDGCNVERSAEMISQAMIESDAERASQSVPSASVAGDFPGGGPGEE